MVKERAQKRKDPEPPLKHTVYCGPVNLSQFPQSNVEADQEKLRTDIALEMKKTHKDLAVINRCMEKTFALRRQEILRFWAIELLSFSKSLVLYKIVLSTEDVCVFKIFNLQVCAEFHHITNQNLQRLFFLH